MRLVDLVKIDHRFEKSVNLLLDLNDRSKLKLYIPTRSSVKLLEGYLNEVNSFSGKRANILIGPYGKGKSHLLLVLMAMLSKKDSEELEDLIAKIEVLDKDAANVIQNTYKKKKLLPVIINSNSGTLAQAFVRSLSQALKHENLQDVVPDSYFSEALIRKLHQSIKMKFYPICCRLVQLPEQPQIRLQKVFIQVIGRDCRRQLRSI